MLTKIDNIIVEYNYTKISEKTIVFLHGFNGNLNNFSYFCKIFNNFGYSTLNINLTPVFYLYKYERKRKFSGASLHDALF